MSPIGDWYLNNEGSWTYDEDAPTPGANPPVTSMLPMIAPEHSAAVHALHGDDPPIVEIYEREDGSIYSRVDPGWFDSFDEVDSRSIVDDGTPPDAA